MPLGSGRGRLGDPNQGGPAARARTPDVSRPGHLYLRGIGSDGLPGRRIPLGYTVGAFGVWNGASGAGSASPVSLVGIAQPTLMQNLYLPGDDAPPPGRRQGERRMDLNADRRRRIDTPVFDPGGLE